MAVLASTIISLARRQLIDDGVQTGFRWSDADLLSYLSDGQRAVVAMRPYATARLIQVILIAGIRQNMPSGAYSFLSVTANLNTSNGEPTGRAVRIVSRQMLTVQKPGWPSETPQKEVLAVMPPEDLESYYYVYPPNNGTGGIELIYSAVPVEIGSLATNITLDDIYQTPLHDYVLYRAYQKDIDNAAMLGVSNSYFAAFERAVKAVV